MSFEQTYPRYPFSELVRLGVCAAKAVLRARHRIATRRDRGHWLSTIDAKPAA